MMYIQIQSFILYNDGSLNDVNSQLVEVEDVLEISQCFRAVIDKEKRVVNYSEKPLEEQKNSAEHKNEVTDKIKSEPIVKFQHLEDEDGLWSMDFDGALGKEGAGIGIWIQSPVCKPDRVPSKVR